MITIQRWKMADCTVGRLTVAGSSFQCFTLELPDKGNAPNVSCIPPGVYGAFKRTSLKNGNVLQLDRVPGREAIQVHRGNFTRQILGCILVGSAVKFLDGDTIPDVVESEKTLAALLALLPDRVQITIKE